MSRQTIAAYSVPDRVAAYEADMELMHPNRSKMVDIALDMLPFQPTAGINAMDLGSPRHSLGIWKSPARPA